VPVTCIPAIRSAVLPVVIVVLPSVIEKERDTIVPNPQFPVSVMVALVDVRGTRLFSISVIAVADSWQSVNPTVLANDIWQRSSEFAALAKFAPKSVPAVVVIDAVDSAGIDCKEIQLLKINVIVVTAAVLNNGILFKLIHPITNSFILVTDDVLNNGKSTNELHVLNIRDILVTDSVLNNGTD